MLAGPIVGVLDWRWLFWIPMIAVTAVAVVAWRVVPPSPAGVPGRINWFSAVLLAGWLVALLLPLSKGASWGWSSGRTIGLLVVAVVLFACWMLSELRSAEPLIDMRMMRLPAVWTTNLVSLLFGAAMFGVFAFLPQLMQVPASTGYGFGATVTGAGLLMLPMMVAMAVSGSVSGPLTRRVSSKAQLLIGAGLGTVSALGLALLHDNRAIVSVTGAIFGIGLGLVYSSMINLIVQSVPRNQTGAASGMNTNIRTIGASIGTAVVSSVVTGHPGAHGLPAESGYTEAFLLLAGASAAALLVALLVPAGRKVRNETPVVLPELTPVEV